MAFGRAGVAAAESGAGQFGLGADGGCVLTDSEDLQSKLGSQTEQRDDSGQPLNVNQPTRMAPARFACTRRLKTRRPPLKTI